MADQNNQPDAQMVAGDHPIQAADHLVFESFTTADYEAIRDENDDEDYEVASKKRVVTVWPDVFEFHVNAWENPVPALTTYHHDNRPCPGSMVYDAKAFDWKWKCEAPVRRSIIPSTISNYSLTLTYIVLPSQPSSS
jgi:hypothetical protein